MMSLEPWTISGCGYPNLLATSEFCDGDTIHDRQHPHDLFMELAAEYDRPLFGTVRWAAYGGPVGEPALGLRHSPIASQRSRTPFRRSLTIGSTRHTSATACSRPACRPAMVEGSVFNGREPDERRYDFDFAALDSVAGRLWFLPIPSVALQVSVGRLNEAEPSHVGGLPVDVDRFTTSAAYHRPFGAGHFLATPAWGANRELGKTTDGFLAESAVSLSGGHTWFGALK